MNTHPVAFVAFEEFDNLGVGYLASVLSESGYEPQFIDFRDGEEKILKSLKKAEPLLVGFSVIFQYHIYEFRKLISYLREGGIKCHFTAGGYYASLKYEELFNLIPSLDSIVRFEGETTLSELVKRIDSGEDWSDIKNLAFRENGKIIINPLRPLENDLDRLPFPVRPVNRNYALGKNFATIIATRGCVNNCSFCNVREYFRQSSGPLKRIRNPEHVAGEIEFLYHKKSCSVFLFEDDDFPVKTEKGSQWIERFCKELKAKKLHDKILWKINCRPDEVDYNTFAMMKSCGLFLVFLGLDDGTDSGLVRLNKHMTITESLKGIDILKQIGIGFDYGFMLFQPMSTFRSINLNLDFLRKICGDGYTPAIFLKLMPYFETRVERALGRAGRLKVRSGFPDYDFLEEGLNHYYEFITECFMEWLRDAEGLVNLSRWARNYSSVFSYYFNVSPDFFSLANNIKNVVSNSNLFLLDTMKELAVVFETGHYDHINYSDLINYRDNIKIKHRRFKEQIESSIKSIYNLVECQSLSQLIFL